MLLLAAATQMKRGGAVFTLGVPFYCCVFILIFSTPQELLRIAQNCSPLLCMVKVKIIKRNFLKKIHMITKKYIHIKHMSLCASRFFIM